MAIDSTTFSPGDNDNNLLRKILAVLNAQGSGSGPTGNVNVVSGNLASAGDVNVTGGSLTSAGAVTIADGADAALGAKADALNLNPATSGSVIAFLKGALAELITVQSDTGGINGFTSAINTATGAKADAAVTNPASDASVIAALKGVLTGVNKIPASPATDASVVANQNVGGYTTGIKDTTAVDTAVYVAGDAVGGKRTIANAVRVSGGTGILESVILLDRANQKAAMTLFIFDSDPTNATITDNAAFVFSTDDVKVIAQVPIAAADYVTTNSKAIAVIKGIGIALKASGSTSLYAALVTSGAPDYAATTDLQLIYGILQD